MVITDGMVEESNKEHSCNREEPIAIVGMGCRFPGDANSPEEFWNVLSQGRDCIVDVPSDRWSERKFYSQDRDRQGKVYIKKGGFLRNLDHFDPEFFGISPREAGFMDPQQRLLLQTLWEALEDGGMNPRELTGSRTGVFVGLFMHDYENIHSANSEYKQMGIHSATGMSTTLAANRLSYIFDFRGPSMVIDTACSSSMIAVHLACRSLYNNEADMCVAGGVNAIIRPENTMILCKASMLSPDGHSKAFDSRANGYARGEGSGMVVLKRLSDAVRNKDPIYALIRSTATNQDGRSDGQTVPSSEAQQAAIAQALERAELTPADIQYVEAHGTGTPTGDPIEAKALGSAMAPGRALGDVCLIGSCKTNIGHTESAAGVASLIKVAMMMKKKQIPPSIHFENPNPEIPFDDLCVRVNTKLRDWDTGGAEKRLAGINSFGFGGSNAHVIVQEYAGEEPAEDKPSVDVPSVVAVSAHNAGALEDSARAYAAFTESTRDDITLQDIAYTSLMRKGQHSQRLTVAANTKKELAENLRAFADGEKRTGMNQSVVSSDMLSGPVFVYSGMGQQWWAMGRKFMETEEVFRNAIEECGHLLKAHTTEWSLCEEMGRSEEDSRINDTAIAQPAIFALQVGLTRLWKSRGIEPAVIVGHSVGEAAAGWACGALSLEDGIKVIYHRSRLQKTTAGTGKMLAVGLSETDATQLLEIYGDTVSIGAINSPTSLTLAGDGAALDDIAAELEARQIFARFLRVEVPYHSPGMDCILDELRNSLADITPVKAHTPLVSTVTGEMTTEPNPDADYWCQNVRNPVRFREAVDTLAAEGFRLFIEIGAHPVLAMSINENLTARNVKGLVLPTLRRKEDEHLMMLGTLGNLYGNGFPVDWEKTFSGRESFVRLPNFSWQNESYWNESESSKASRLGSGADAAVHPLSGERLPGAVQIWQNEIDLEQLPYIGDHKVQGSVFFPGAGFVEMGLARVGTVPANIEDIEIFSPLILTGQTSATIQTVLAEDGAFSIHSRVPGGESWTCHAGGTVRRRRVQAPNRVDLDALQKECPREEKRSDSYARFHSLGLEYGPEFQCIENLKLGEGRAFGRVTCSDKVAESLGDYLLHPVVLDASFQVMASMPIDGTYLPVGIKQVTLYRKPSATCFCYARLTRRRFDRITGDIRIVDENGVCIADVKGLTCRYVEGTRKSDTTIEQDIYEYKWFLRSREDVQHNNPILPELKKITDSVRPELPRLTETHDRKRYYSNVRPALDDLSRAYAAKALSDLGYTFTPEESGTVDELADRLKVGDDHKLLLNRLFYMLAQNGTTVCENNVWRALKQPTSRDPESMWRKRMREFPCFSSELILSDRCGRKLAGIMNGTENPMDVLFSSGTNVLEHLYQTSPTFLVYNRIAQRFAASLVRSLPEGRPLRILEIGAGTGAMTSYLLPALPADSVEYVFTDISPAFTAKARERFKGYPFIDFQILDIDVDTKKQGVETGSFDLIVAADVIHATSRLAVSLERIKDLLTDNGMLMMLEVTDGPFWFDLVFGTLKGWWLFSDKEIRPDHALMSERSWLNLLDECGYVQACGLSDSTTDTPGLHSIILAQKPAAAEAIADKPETVAPGSIENQDRPWLILADESGIAGRFKAILETHGVQPTIVGDSDSSASFDRTIALNSQQEMKRLFSETCTDSSLPPVVVFMTDTVRGMDPEMDSETLRRQSNQSCERLLYLYKAVSERDWNSEPEVWIVTGGAQTVEKNHAPSLAQTTLWGFGRVAANEYDQLKTRLVDLSLNPDDVELAALAGEIVGTADGEDEIALREDRRYVHRFVRVHEPHASRESMSQFRLCKSGDRQLEGFRIEETQRNMPGADEVEVEVRAVSLNAFDLDRVTGRLEPDISDHGFITGLGVEYSGVIRRVGENVKGFSQGDAVIGLAKDACRRFINTGTSLLCRKPGDISYEAAATMPASFVRADYIVNEALRVESGESVLVICGNDDTGLAVIHAAEQAGASIFAADSDFERRKLLQSMGINCLDLEYTDHLVEDVLRWTGGKGVDVLVGDFSRHDIGRLTEVIRTGSGRIADLAASPAPRLSRWISGVAYQHVPVEQILSGKHRAIRRLWQMFVQKLEAGDIQPLPYRLYPLNEHAEAFENLEKSAGFGKTVLSLNDSGIRPLPTTNSLPLKSDRTYLLVGGLGGFGLAVARWMIQCGAKHLALLGRSGDDRAEARQAVSELRDSGAEVFVGRCDVTVESDVEAILSSIRENMPPLAGVVQAAMVLEDVFISTMTIEQLKKVMEPKVLGSWNLHRYTREDDLDFFLSFSSSSSLVGNPGQANYSAGNAFLDALGVFQRNRGVPGLTIGWGAIGDVGYVSQRKEIVEHFERQGVRFISLEQAWRTIAYSLDREMSHIGLLPVDWRKFNRYIKKLANSPRFETVIGKALRDAGTEISSDSAAEFQGVPDDPAERKGYLIRAVSRAVCDVLGISVEKIDTDKALESYGLDSLMAVELNVQVQALTGVDLPKMTFLQAGLTVTGLADLLEGMLGGSDSVESPGKASDDTIDDLSEEEVDRMLKSMQENAQ